MRKLLSVILLIAAVFAFSACGSYPVEGEKNALDVYTCSDKNMLGLEKLVIFEDHVVLVFDRKAPKTGYELNIDEIMRSKNLTANAYLTDTNDFISTSKYDGTAEIFVVTIYVTGSNGDTKIINPVQGRSVSHISIQDYTLTINSGDLKISRVDETQEGRILHYQTYNQVSKKWSKINQQPVGHMVEVQ